MPSDRERWDARHAADAERAHRAPDAFIAQALRDLGPGADRRAVDLACGTGRHALLMAELGWDTEAWDVSPIALGVVDERARAQSVRMTTRLVDLGQALPTCPPWSLVVVVDYLDRRLLEQLGERLAPGGSLLFATFTDAWPEPHPSRRFRLRGGELARGLPGFSTVRETEAGGRAALWAKAREDSGA